MTIIAIADRVKRYYFETLRKRDFHYMERGLPLAKEHEYLIAGKLELDSQNKRFVIRKPDLLIASDRLDYYDFLGRRRESLSI